MSRQLSCGIIKINYEKARTDNRRQERIIGLRTRILGIDPGYAIVGCGVVEYDGSRFVTLDYGAITTEAGTEFTGRLAAIYDGVCQLLEMYHPHVMAIEKLYFNTIQKSAINVAQARGVILLAARKFDVPVYEYTPLQVKQSVVGYGRAVKQQVIEMTTRILNLKKAPKPDDVADALAIAICHAHSVCSQMGGVFREIAQGRL